MESSASFESLASSDKILAKGRFTVLEQLKKDRTALQFSVLGKNYERLTLVTGLKDGNDGPYVLLLCPVGFTEMITDFAGAAVKVEFVGKDKIQYAFRSHIRMVSDEDLCIEFPEFIERIQRRRYFRIAPPIGTKVVFTKDGEPLEASVINLSEGGSLLSLPASSPKEEKVARRVTQGDYLRNLRLLCEGKYSRVELTVRKALVKRAEKNSQTGRYILALQFADMEKRETNMLHEYIFRCQRELPERKGLFEES
ncbi:MAG: PilZ domain-containing protein [Pseudomonadota bacterium]